MTILTKQNLAILEATQKTKENVYHLDHVMIENGAVWASNGHSLWSSILTEFDIDYPDMDVNGAEHKECMIIPASALRKAEKNITSKQNNKILESVQVLIDDNFKHLVTTDLDTTQDVKVKHTECPEWPAYKQIVATWSDNLPKEQSVGLSLAELETMVKILKKSGNTECLITVNGRENMVQVKAPGLVGYIMPIKLDF